MINIPNTNLGISVPIEKYNEIHTMLKTTMRDYQFLTKSKCTKGKALLYLINHGFNKFQELVDRKYEELNKKKKQIDKSRVEEIIE